MTRRKEVPVAADEGSDRPDPVTADNTVKDPDEWTTGDEPMTGAQRSYLKTLSDQAGEAFDENLTKAQASKRIDELQARTGRSGGTNQP
jgi:Protein of unknown function (DUF3072)